MCGWTRVVTAFVKFRTATITSGWDVEVNDAPILPTKKKKNIIRDVIAGV